MNRIKLSDLPPVSHMELGRGQAFLPARRHDLLLDGPTNANLVFNKTAAVGKTEDVVGEMTRVLEEMKRTIDEIVSVPFPPPVLDPDHILVLPHEHHERRGAGVDIYWTDSQGRTWGPRGRVA